MRDVRLIHLLPTMLSVSIGIFGTLIIEYSNVSQYLGISFIFEDDALSVALSTVLFFVLMLLGTVILLILLRFKALPIINGMYFLLILITGFYLYQIYVISLTMLLGMFIDENVIWLISVTLSLVTSLTVLFSRKEVPIFTILTLYGGLLGPVIRLIMPLWSIILLLILISAYDIYSVSRGPLKRIIETIRGDKAGEGLPPIRGALVPFKGISLGMGDIVFYSLLTSTSIVFPKLSLLRGFIVATLIVTGYYFTLKLVKKRGYAPALPIPITLGLIGLLVSMVIGI